MQYSHWYSACTRKKKVSPRETPLSRTAATAAKSLQSCPTLCDPIDGSPPGSSVYGILQARTLESVAISSSNVWKWKVKVKSLSRVQLLATPWTAAHQAPLSTGFSRQEYWSGLLFPSPLGTHKVSHLSGLQVRYRISLNVFFPHYSGWFHKKATIMKTLSHMFAMQENSQTKTKKSHCRFSYWDISESLYR